MKAGEKIDAPHPPTPSLPMAVKITAVGTPPPPHPPPNPVPSMAVQSTEVSPLPVSPLSCYENKSSLSPPPTNIQE